MQFLMPKPTPPPAKPETPQEQPAATSSAPPSTNSAASTPPPAQKPGSTNSKKKTAAVAPPPAPSKQATSETKTTIDSSSYRITFSNHGAVVTSWILKKYKNNGGKPCTDQSLDGCLDLVNPVTAAALGPPLSLLSYDKDLEKKLNDAMYVASSTGTQSAPTSISF